MRSGASWTTNPLAYELEILTLVNNEGVGYDIRELMMECNIYESITSNFLVGEIAISDAIGLLENAKIFGQETLRVRFTQPTGRSPAGPPEDLIDQVFRIYKVSGVHKIGQNTNVYKLSFCAPELIHAKRIRISQAFHGVSLSNIAAQIGKEKLGIIPLESNAEAGGQGPKLKPHFENILSSQGENNHVVIPNWTVNYAINWLLQQAQGVDSQSGFNESFFFFQTARGGYRIQSLADMMKVEYLGGGKDAFHYAPAAASGVDKKGKSPEWNEKETGIGAGRRILDYTIGKTANVLEGTMEGLFAQKQITINNTEKCHTTTTFNFLEKFYSQKKKGEEYPLVRNMPEELFYGEAAAEDDTADVVCSKYENTEIYGKPISDYPDAHTTLTSDSNFVNDEENSYTQANYETHLGSEQLRTAVRQLLKYYTMNALISARTDVSCGEWITLKIPAVRGQKTGEIPDAKFHTGKYLITEIKWGLTNREMRTNIKVVKDSYFNQIETAAAEYAPLTKLTKTGKKKQV